MRQSKMGGRGSCRAKTTANGDWRLAIGQTAARQSEQAFLCAKVMAQKSHLLRSEGERRWESAF